MKKIILCFIPLLLACNNKEKDKEILKLKGILKDSELSGSDSLKIYNYIKEENSYKEVYKMLDSLKAYDNKKYKILLDAAAIRDLEEAEE